MRTVLYINICYDYTMRNRLDYELPFEYFPTSPFATACHNPL